MIVAFCSTRVDANLGDGSGIWECDMKCFQGYYQTFMDGHIKPEGSSH